jgi:hypothetical protein
VLHSKSASTPASPMLCKTCRDIFQNSFRPCIPYPRKYERGRSNDIPNSTPDIPCVHQVTAESLRHSASQNCFFCTAIIKSLPAEITSDISAAFTSYYIWPDNLDDRDRRGAYGEEKVPIKNFLRLSFALGSGPETNAQAILLDYLLFLTDGNSPGIRFCI